MESSVGVLDRIGKTIPAPGRANVDFEERFDFRRLHQYRVGRLRDSLERAELGAVLVFDMNNIRYATSTHIGEWARDKMARFALVTRTGEPYLWDFGSAARKNRLHAPWLDPGHINGGVTGLRGAVPPQVGLFKHFASVIQSILIEEGVADLPLGVDLIELPMMFELQKLGLRVVDGQQAMLGAREVKSPDEIVLLSVAAAMVEGVFQRITEILKPGIRENEIVGIATKMLYDMGSEDVEGINAVSGERCTPHPHVFTDRLIRPGDQAYFDIMHAYNGYRTCYYRTFAVGRATPVQHDAYEQARDWMDAAIELLRPGASTADIAQAWPRAEEFGFASEMEAFGLQFGHGLGLALHERPVISRLNSLDHPEEIKEGMVIAIETYCPAKDGVSAARIEEEVVITQDGPTVITLFPGEHLMVTNPY